MKKTNFTQRLSKVAQEALDFIEKSVKKGKMIRLFTEQEREENDNIIYDMPNATYVGKHGDYSEYAVVAVSHPVKIVLPTEIILHLEGKGEESGTKIELPLNELGNNYQLSDVELCELADELSKLIK